MKGKLSKTVNGKGNSLRERVAKIEEVDREEKVGKQGQARGRERSGRTVEGVRVRQEGHGSG